MKTYAQMDEYQQRKVRMLQCSGGVKWDEAEAVVARGDIKRQREIEQNITAWEYEHFPFLR